MSADSVRNCLNFMGYLGSLLIHSKPLPDVGFAVGPNVLVEPMDSLTDETDARQLQDFIPKHEPDLGCLLGMISKQHEVFLCLSHDHPNRLS